MELVVKGENSKNYVLTKKLSDRYHFTFNRRHLKANKISAEKFKYFIRNYLLHTKSQPAKYVDLTEKFVKVDVYNMEKQFTGSKFLYILEGRSY